MVGLKTKFLTVLVEKVIRAPYVHYIGFWVVQNNFCGSETDLSPK